MGIPNHGPMDPDVSGNRDEDRAGTREQGPRYHRDQSPRTMTRDHANRDRTARTKGPSCGRD